MLREKIFQKIVKDDYFSNHDKVLIAVSTGHDSMSLLEILYEYRQQLGITIGIVHVNHKQRPESELEAQFLKNWAKDHKLAFHLAEFNGVFSEDRARQFRYDFFRQVMVEFGYTALVTAHHKDDQAETILMRLIRGGRLRYLSGIKAVQPFATGELIRPLLAFTKAELPEVTHFEDSSNHSMTHFRNRIRHRYLPELSQENPRLVERLDQLAHEVQQVYQILDQVIDLTQVQQLAYFQSQPVALQCYLLETYLTNFPHLSIKRQQFENLLALVQNDQTYQMTLKKGYFFKKDDQMFEITQIGPKTDSTLIDKVLKYDQSMVLNDYRLSFAPESSAGFALTSQADIHVRHRKPGDTIHFERFSKKLRRLFIDQKIPKEMRETALILEQEGIILAVIVSGKTYLRKAPKDGIIQGKLVIEKLESW